MGFLEQIKYVRWRVEMEERGVTCGPENVGSDDVDPNIHCCAIFVLQKRPLVDLDDVLCRVAVLAHSYIHAQQGGDC